MIRTTSERGVNRHVILIKKTTHQAPRMFQESLVLDGKVWPRPELVPTTNVCCNSLLGIQFIIIIYIYILD